MVLDLVITEIFLKNGQTTFRRPVSMLTRWFAERCGCGLPPRTRSLTPRPSSRDGCPWPFLILGPPATAADHAASSTCYSAALCSPAATVQARAAASGLPSTTQAFPATGSLTHRPPGATTLITANARERQYLDGHAGKPKRLQRRAAPWCWDSATASGRLLKSATGDWDDEINCLAKSCRSLADKVRHAHSDSARMTGLLGVGVRVRRELCGGIGITLVGG